MDDIGDVAMHKDVAWLKAQDGGLWAARVGASDPEDLGLLAAAERGVFLGVGGRPLGFVEFKSGLEFVCLIEAGGGEWVSLVVASSVCCFCGVGVG